MNISIFHTNISQTKIAISPFNDMTFVFENKKVNLEGFLDALRNNFVLNRSYKFPGKIRLRRTKGQLAPFLTEKLEYIIIDFDKVKDKESRDFILSYLTKKDYYVGVIPSRSYNGKTSFNMKAVIKAKGLNNRYAIKEILEEINEDLYKYCKIDFSSTREGSYQAPAFKEETLLIHKGKYIPTSYAEEPEIINLNVENEIVNICIKKFHELGFRQHNFLEDKGIIAFSHPNEVKSPKGYFLFVNYPFVMHHFDPSKNISIFHEVKENQKVREYFELLERENRIKEFNNVGSFDKRIIINDKYINVNDEIKKFINEFFENNGVLKIKSPMGSGKSSVISEIIKKAKEQDKSCLLITNRVSVARDFKDKYGIKLYNEDVYEQGDDLIVQFDSLWKYSLKHFDVVIIDEFVSVMLHSRNKLTENVSLNRMKLFYALKKKSVVIADAFLFGLEDTFVKNKPKFLIENLYREEINFLCYDEIDSIVYEIIQKANESKANNKMISISCSSKILAESLKEILENQGLKIIFLNAETSEEERVDIFENFKNGKKYSDVLIFTPTLTVGVSVLFDIDHHFHIDESTTVDVISSLQMIRRVRKASNIHCYVKKRKRILTTKEEVLIADIEANLSKYLNNKNSFLVSYDEDGDIKISDLGLFYIKTEILYNKLEVNHKHSFEILLSHQMKSKIKRAQKNNIDFNLSDIKKSIKERKKKEALKVLNKLKEKDYNEDILSLYQQRKYVFNEEEKMLKLMSEIKKRLYRVKSKELKEITEIEINSNFRFIGKLKRLKFYLSKSAEDIENILSNIISEDLDSKTLSYLKYVLSLKNKGVKLRNKVTLKEINEIDAKIKGGSFKSFLLKIGYKKQGTVYILPVIYTKYLKYVRV